MTYLNFLEGAVNHGDEHVEQHYHHGNVVNPIKHITNVLNEFVPVVDHHRLDLRQSKYSPEQCLEALLQAKRAPRRKHKENMFYSGKAIKYAQKNPTAENLFLIRSVMCKNTVPVFKGIDKNKILQNV